MESGPIDFKAIEPGTKVRFINGELATVIEKDNLDSVAGDVVKILFCLFSNNKKVTIYYDDNGLPLVSEIAYVIEDLIPEGKGNSHGNAASPTL